MEDKWFIIRDDKKYGPYLSPQMKQMAVAAQLLPADMVSRTGSEPWLSASQVPAFFPATTKAPPSAPMLNDE